MKTATTLSGTRSYRLWLLMILLLSASVIGAQETDLVRISHDPYTDSLGQHASEVESHLAADGDTIVASIQVGRFYNSGSDNTGWATSKDADHTWRQGFLNGLTTIAGGTGPSGSLPTVAFDRKHGAFLISFMTFDADGNGRGALVSRSYGGLHWSKPVVADTSAGTFGHWLACDNSPASKFYGNCYDALYDYATGPSLNVLVTSSDGGVTWGPLWM